MSKLASPNSVSTVQLQARWAVREQMVAMQSERLIVRHGKNDKNESDDKGTLMVTGSVTPAIAMMVLKASMCLS